MRSDEGDRPRCVVLLDIGSDREAILSALARMGETERARVEVLLADAENASVERRAPRTEDMVDIVRGMRGMSSALVRESAPSSPGHPCPCGRPFRSAQGLKRHRRDYHGDR